MSTGLNCLFVELEAGGDWYYLLEDWDAPKGAYNWREYATAYGPFVDEHEAHRHLQRNHANPGGAMYDRYGGKPVDNVTARLIAEAKK